MLILENNYINCSITQILDIKYSELVVKHLKSMEEIRTTNLTDAYKIARLLDFWFESSIRINFTMKEYNGSNSKDQPNRTTTSGTD